MRCSRPALLLAVLFLAGPAAVRSVTEEGEALRPGEVRELSIAAGETHTYRIEVADIPLLVTVEQRGIDLVIETQGPAARASTDAGYLRWQSEVLLLESQGGHRLEIHPRELAGLPGRYILRTEALSDSPEKRRAALSLLSRAGQEAFARDSEARRRAVASFREALAAWRSLGERRWEAESLDAMAGLEIEERELRPAAEHSLQALAIWRELAEPLREAATLNNLGLSRLYMGEGEAAREALQSALALWQRLEERFEPVEIRSNLCFLDHLSGALPTALRCYQEIQPLYRELGDQLGEATLHNNLGGVYDLLAEPDAALNHYEQALALRRELGDRAGEAQTLNNIAVIHRVLGEWQEALRLYGQAREILAVLGDRSQEAAQLINVGFAYNTLGEPQRALGFLEEALELLRKIGDRRSEAITLNHLGSAWRKLGDPDKALDHHRRALALAVALGDRRQEAITRLRLGEVLIEQGAHSAALLEIDPALGYLRQTALRHGELQALQLRGGALALAGRPREAIPVFQEVLAQRRAIRDRAGEVEALLGLAAAERSLNLREEARAHAGEAVARVEELRSGFISPALRAAFLATQRSAYSLLIDLYMEWHAVEPGVGHDRKAFQVSERARARSLLDVLQSGGVRPGEAVPAALLERRQSLRRRLSLKADQQVKQGGAKAETSGREIETLLAELDSVEAEIRRLDPLYAAVSMPPSLGAEDIARLLDPGTLLLEYSLGEERSYLWEIGAGGSFRSFVLPPQREIEALARQLYDELSTLDAGTGRRSSAAAELSRTLLGPLGSEASRRRLVVVPDAALHLLPFGALPAPGSGGPLLDQLEISYLPSATTLALQRERLEHRPAAAKWAAVFADPVFAPDDPRLPVPSVASRQARKEDPQRGGEAGGLLPGFERLPSSRTEAEEIASLAPRGQVWTALNFEASREAVLTAQLRDYRVVHFATHAIADTRNPELSGLVLSLVDAAGRPREGFLGLSEIYELNLGADLVVLSGCRTALGKEVRGEGLMGLTRGFLYAGVPRVVASLWRVQDRTTAELMTHFYRALWRDRLPAAAALRAAQQSLRNNPRYRDPYSWAGFVLQGDWR